MHAFKQWLDSKASNRTILCSSSYWCCYINEINKKAVTVNNTKDHSHTMSLEFFDPRKGITISISLFLVNAKYFEICSTAIDGTDNIKLMIGKYSLNALMISTLLNYKKLVMLLLFYITMANSSLITVIFHVFRQKHLVLLSLFKTKTKQEKYSSFQIDSSK